MGEVSETSPGHLQSNHKNDAQKNVADVTPMEVVPSSEL